MASTSNSETTPVVPDDHPVHPIYRPAGYSEGQELHNPRSHDENLPDISFPFITTDINRGGLTNEYRAFTREGYVSADHALRPIPTHVSDIPGDLKDPEKAARLRDMKLVTWLPDDPEDPRNWSNMYKWCMYCLPDRRSSHSDNLCRSYRCVRHVCCCGRVRVRCRYG